MGLNLHKVSNRSVELASQLRVVKIESAKQVLILGGAIDVLSWERYKSPFLYRLG